MNSPYIPKWEVSLRREAIIRSAHSSTAIEGNRLSLEQVSDLAQGREIMANPQRQTGGPKLFVST
jgi:Fic family protein